MKKEKKREILKIVRIIAVALLLLAIFKGVLILVILMGLSFSMSYIVNNFGLRKIGLELVTFIAVITGMKYGPWIALLITFILISYHIVAGGFLDTYILWVIPAYCLGGIIAGFLPHMDVVLLGILVTLGICGNNLFWTAMTSPGNIPNYMIYVVTNIMFNVFLFSVFGRIILLLMI